MAETTIPADALPLAVVDGRGQKPSTPQQVELLKLFNKLRSDEMMLIRQDFKSHGYIPGTVLRQRLGIPEPRASLRDTTESDIA